MKECKMERIQTRIEYTALEHPTCRVLINNRLVHNFVGDDTAVEFDFEVDSGDFTFTLEHHGKDMKKQAKKFIEIKKIYFNDIDIKNMIWETVQKPKMPHWQNYKDYKWESNLFLGHNSTIDYKLSSPIVNFLFDYHQPSTKVSAGMTSQNTSFMAEMKEYFTKKVQEQKNEKH